MSAATLLVLGAGGNVSQGILKALAAGDLDARVVAACVDPLSAGLHLADRALISPLAADPGFLPWLLEVCRAERVDGVLSGVEPVLTVLSRHAAEIRAETGAICLVSPPETLAVGDDKLETCRWLAERGHPHPRFADAADRSAVAELVERCGFPLVAKPRGGRAARGLEIVREDRDLQRVGDGFVVQEHLPAEAGEYTAGCLCDAGGRLLGTTVLRRELENGTTQRATAGEFHEIREVAERIVRDLAPVGPCNVQLRIRDDGGPVPFELNVRFSGTSPIRARLGANDVEAAVRHIVLGEPAGPLPRVTSGTAIRYVNEVYVPDDAVEELRRTGRLDDPRARVEDWGAES